MDLTFDIDQLTLWNGCIRTLSKLSESLVILATAEQVSLVAVNDATTVSGLIIFNRDFFGEDSYNFYPVDAVKPSLSGQDRKPKDKKHSTAPGFTKHNITVSVPSKHLVAAMRTSAKPAELACKMTIVQGKVKDDDDSDMEDEDEDVEEKDELRSRIHVVHHSKASRSKEYQLIYEDAKPQVPLGKVEDKPSHFKVDCRVFSEWVDHFHLSTGRPGTAAYQKSGGTAEVTFYCQREELKVVAFAHQDGVGFTGADAGKPLYTSLITKVDQLDEYKIKKPFGSEYPIMTFALKELRIISSFAKQHKMPLSAHFSDGPEALLISLKVPGEVGQEVECTFYLATTRFDYDNPTGGAMKNSQATKKEQKPDTKLPFKKLPKPDAIPFGAIKPPTSSSAVPPADVDFDAMMDDDGFDLNDDDLAQIDLLSQAAASQSASRQGQGASAAQNGTGNAKAGPSGLRHGVQAGESGSGAEEDEDEDEDEGPVTPHKKARRSS